MSEETSPPRERKLLVYAVVVFLVLLAAMFGWKELSMFRFERSIRAERDAEEILEWLLSEKSGQAGIDWFLALDDAFGSLKEFPERCPVAPESAL